MARPRTTFGPCAVAACARDASVRGMCKRHYDRVRLIQRPRCYVADCFNPSRAGSGICTSCTQRLRRTGTLDRRTLKRRNVRGYIVVWAPDHPMAREQGYVLEHRMVAFDAGLLTNPDDHVHHINHDSTDNRLENLEVLSPEEHATLHADETRKDWERARYLYEVQGWSTVQVAAELGTHPGNVSRQLRSLGVEMRKAGDVKAATYRAARSQPGWFKGRKSRVGHYAPHGSEAGWLAACGLRIAHPGVVSEREFRRCPKCEEASA